MRSFCDLLKVNGEKKLLLKGELLQACYKKTRKRANPDQIKWPFYFLIYIFFSTGVISNRAYIEAREPLSVMADSPLRLSLDLRKELNNAAPRLKEMPPSKRAAHILRQWYG